MGGNFQNLQELLASYTLGFALFRRMGQGNALAFSQLVYGLREGQIFHQHDELKNVSPCLASETIENLLGLADRKGRGFLIVKGTERPVILAFLLQTDVSAH